MVLSRVVAVGRTVGQYRLHEILGSGAMGVVYRGKHIYLGREVAIKVLRFRTARRGQAIKWFLREARAASRVRHPGIVDVTDFGKSADGTVFLVMELVRGEPLDVVIRRERRFKAARAIDLALQIADAIGAAHRQGIVHRDLKPQNVMVAIRADPPQVRSTSTGGRGPRFESIKLLDFGVAKMHDPATGGCLTGPDSIVGTAEYMAPETARGQAADVRSDVYSVAVVLYEMLAGSVPFRGVSPAETMLKAATEAVPPLRTRAPDLETTPEIEDLLIRALAKNPEERHQSTDELLQDLRRCRARLPAPAMFGVSPSPSRCCRWNPGTGLLGSRARGVS